MTALTDLTNPFDPLNHVHLLSKKDYLSNRCQYVQVTNHKSFPLASVVPHGLILRSRFFINFINDIANTAYNTSCQSQVYCQQ